ncbi:MAG: type IV pilin protein [Pseudomonadota bacterium]
MLNKRAPTLQRQQSGFTLMELMIVVVIVAVLAAIGLPSYQNSVVRATRTDTQSALIGFAQAMEKHFNQNYTYLGAGAGGNNTGAPDGTVFPNQAPIEGQPFYDLSIEDSDDNGFRLRATPIAGSRQDGDGILEIDSLGRRGWDRDGDGAIANTELNWNR